MPRGCFGGSDHLASFDASGNRPLPRNDSHPQSRIVEPANVKSPYPAPISGGRLRLMTTSKSPEAAPALDAAIPGSVIPQNCPRCSAVDTTVSSQHPHTDVACAGCVAQATSLPQRVEAIRAAIADEAEPLVTITHFLRLCRDEHPVLWERINDPVCCAKLASIVTGVQTALAAPNTTATLSANVRRVLANALTASQHVPAVVVARGLAELLDEHYGHSFTESFRRRSPYQPSVGDPIPLDNPDLRRITALPATSPPWRLANRLDETRRIRLAGEWATQYQVIFDYSIADALTGLIDKETVIATCHPNRSLAEIAFPRNTNGRSFPVHPVHPEQQRREIDRLLERAVDAGASVIVLPELCVTESLARQLQAWTERPAGPRLLVAGSYHHADNTPEADGQNASTRRRNTAVAFVRGVATALTYDKHSPADRPVVEDIQPEGWPRLPVYVSSDGWHLMITICRDLLNPHAVHALTEAGVNLALVPAMSESLVAFGGPVAHLVGSGQALVAVANNPADFSEPADRIPHRPARALFGHPGFGQQTRLVQPAGDEPGIALFRVATGQVQWLGLPPAIAGQQKTQTVDTSFPRSMPPPWAARMARCIEIEPARGREIRPSVTLRTSAVLVLLTDSPDGPNVLLTERASDLTHYPGQLVFPGGATEQGDGSPTATALREAGEEIGLDPTSVHILGVLPSFALPDSGFLLTPVLGWSPRPTFTGSANRAEVSSLETIPLRDARQSQPRRPPSESGRDGAARPRGAPIGVITQAILDLLIGMLTGGQDALTDMPTQAPGVVA
jgi:8-oxo-dGTP pyrophosphatase MutT (NUDIX family)